MSGDLADAFAMRELQISYGVPKYNAHELRVVLDLLSRSHCLQLSYLAVGSPTRSFGPVAAGQQVLRLFSPYWFFQRQQRVAHNPQKGLGKSCCHKFSVRQKWPAGIGPRVATYTSRRLTRQRQLLGTVSAIAQPDLRVFKRGYDTRPTTVLRLPTADAR